MLLDGRSSQKAIKGWKDVERIIAVVGELLQFVGSCATVSLPVMSGLPPSRWTNTFGFLDKLGPGRRAQNESPGGDQFGS